VPNLAKPHNSTGKASSTVLTEIENLESELLAAASDDYRKGKQHLQGSIVQEDARIALMVEQERQEKEGAEADSEEYEQSVIDPHRITLLNEIEATGIHMASIRAKLQSVGDKLTYTSMIRSQLVRGNGGKPDLTIVRRDGPALICMKADDHTELSPDDSSPIARSCRPCGSEPTPAGR
jgi:polysaccharide biosynthesis/export protein